MISYVLQRLLAAVPVLFGTLLITFAMVKTLPGDSATYLLGDWGSYSDLVAMRKALGLDEPVPIQFLRYVERLAIGDLGTSVLSKRAIAPELLERAGLTSQLAMLSLAFGTTAGVTIGVLAAVRRNTVWDTLLRVLALVGVSMPTFLSGLVLMYVFGFQLALLPISGYSGLLSLALPSATLAIVITGSVMRVTRSSLVEALAQEYVRTARAKGLRERVIASRHALRNSLLVVVTLIGLQFGQLLAGAIVVETIFALPGLGSWGLEGILKRDLPVVQAVVLVAAASFMLINIAVDVVYGFLDPRIRVR